METTHDDRECYRTMNCCAEPWITRNLCADVDKLEAENTRLGKLLAKMAQQFEAARGERDTAIQIAETNANERDAIARKREEFRAEVERLKVKVASARQDVVNELAAEVDHALDNAKKVMEYGSDEGRARELSAMTLRNLVFTMTLGDTVENNLRADLARLTREREEMREWLVEIKHERNMADRARRKAEKALRDHSAGAGKPIEDDHPVFPQEPNSELVRPRDEGALDEIEKQAARIAELEGAIEKHKHDAFNCDPRAMASWDAELWRVLDEVKHV